MDSADSMGVVAKEGGGVAAAAATEEDEGFVAAALVGKEAAGLFAAGKYAECVDLLNQLKKKRPNDPKVLHNIAIATFFSEGCTNPKKLLDELETLVPVKQKCDAAPASGEQEDTTPEWGNRAITVPKGIDTVPHQISTLNGETLVYSEEFDASLATLNMAIVRFNCHEFSEAKSRLKSLFLNIEPIDEETALRVCELLLDVAITTQDNSAFMDVLNYIARDYKWMINQADNGTTGQQQSSNLPPKYASSPGGVSVSDGLSSDASGPRSSLEDSLNRTLSEDTNFETLITTMKTGEQNLPRASNIYSYPDPSRSPEDPPPFAIDFKLKLPLYHIQHLILTRSLKAAKKELKQVITTAPSSRALLLKAQVEYALGNYPKAMKLLEASNNQKEVESSIISNNYGCIFLRQGNPHTSGIFLQKALNGCSALRKEQPKSITSFSQDKSPFIMYNCGLQLLACGKPKLAAHCFMNAGSVFLDRSLLWLRIAECCLMAVEKGSFKSSVSMPHLSGKINAHVVGQGQWRYLAMHKVSLRNGANRTKEGATEVHRNDSKLELSVTFARQCLKSALFLLRYSKSKESISPSKPNEDRAEPGDAPSPKHSSHKSSSGGDSKPASKETISSGPANSNGDVKDQKGRTSGSTDTWTSIPEEYDNILRREKQMIYQAVLVDLAFLELELGNPLTALTHARALLELPDCSKMHAFLGRIYAAEALSFLRRPKEAAEFLSVYLTEGNKVELPYTSEDCDQWQIKRTVDSEDSNTALKAAPAGPDVFLKPEEARGTTFINLAVMFTIQGDLKQARSCLDEVLSVRPESPEAVLMATILDLKHGDTERAISKLRRCSRVSFLPLVAKS